ncbi:MAG: VOC family protein [Bryobacteraceae bacterium]|jgi:catechol 2,3-dioxygenase-like lactoylglutathione lyase family enzyme
MTNLPQRAALAVALVFSSFGGAASLRAQDARALDGIAHVALRVSDVARSRAFYKTLGWEQAFEFSDDKGTTTSYVKVSDSQFIELYRRNHPTDPLGLMHICLLTGDVDRVSAAYRELGLAPTQPRKAHAGNVLFNLRDPEGQVIEYTQYLPGSLHYEDHGKHLDPARISNHMIGVAMTVKDVDAEKAFFTGKLGFSGSGYKLSVPGNAAETIELRPPAAGAMPELRFAANPKQAAGELKTRGLEVKITGGIPEVRDPDGTVISFSER